MQICMLVNNYQEQGVLKTGADTQAELQVKALGALGHTITLIARKHTLGSRWYEKIGGCAVYRVGPPGLRSIMTCLLLLKNRQFDIVHMHGQHSFSIAAILLCRLLAIPTVFKITIAGRVFVRTPLDKLLPNKWRLFRKFSNHIARMASSYIAISNEIAEELPRAKYYPGRIRQMPNGIDGERFYPAAPNEKDLLRQQLGLPVDRKVILYASRLTGRKGYDVLLTGWESISRKFPDACLVIVGGGDKTAVREVQGLAQSQRERIFYYGHVDDTAPYLKCADLFIFPSRKEGLPNGLIEAMACGCPCIASDIGGCRDLITPYQTGILFPYGDAGVLAEKTCELLGDAEKAKQLGQAAHTHIRENYDIAIVAKRLEGIYNELVTVGT